jgi:hypothetical protein
MQTIPLEHYNAMNEAKKALNKEAYLYHKQLFEFYGCEAFISFVVFKHSPMYRHWKFTHRNTLQRLELY